MSQASTPAKHRATDAPSTTSSPSELERGIEATRDHLASSLDQLLYRLKPSTILSRQMQEIRAHFVDEQGSLRTDKVAGVAAAAVGVVGFFVVVRVLNNRKS